MLILDLFILALCFIAVKTDSKLALHYMGEGVGFINLTEIKFKIRSLKSKWSLKLRSEILTSISTFALYRTSSFIEWAFVFDWEQENDFELSVF